MRILANGKRRTEEHRMDQQQAWPVELEPQEDGTILVSFPNVPEALTEGETVYVKRSAGAGSRLPDCRTRWLCP